MASTVETELKKIKQLKGSDVQAILMLNSLLKAYSTSSYCRDTNENRQHAR